MENLKKDLKNESLFSMFNLKYTLKKKTFKD